MPVDNGVVQAIHRAVQITGSDVETRKLSVYDFAGQRMYYVMHQILLTEALTIYVVAVSLQHELGEQLRDHEDEKGQKSYDNVFGMSHGENLDFWLNSIHAKAPKARAQMRP